MNLITVIIIILIVLALLIIRFIINTEDEHLIKLMKRLLVTIVILAILVVSVVGINSFLNNKKDKKDNKGIPKTEIIDNERINNIEQVEEKNNNNDLNNNQVPEEKPKQNNNQSIVNSQKDNASTNNNQEVREESKAPEVSVEVKPRNNETDYTETSRVQAVYEEEEEMAITQPIIIEEPQVEEVPTPSEEPVVKEPTPTKPTPEKPTPTPTKPTPEKPTPTKPTPTKPTLSKDNNMIYFLNVGASTDSFIIKDNGKYGLIDTSLPKKGDYIVKTLKKLKVKELDFILITHSHKDHTGGYEKVMKNFKVKTLYIKKDGAKYPAHQDVYKKLIKIAKNKSTSICDVKQKKCQSFSLGYTKFKLYNTGFLSAKKISIINKDRFDNANSIATVATINGKRIYFAGDIGNYFGHNQESTTAKKIGDIDVYKAAHHGYISYNNHQDALNKLKPEYTVVTNDSIRSAIAVSRIKKANKKYKKTYYTVKGTIKLNVTSKGKLVFKQ